MEEGPKSKKSKETPETKPPDALPSTSEEKKEHAENLETAPVESPEKGELSRKASRSLDEETSRESPEPQDESKAGHTGREPSAAEKVWRDVFTRTVAGALLVLLGAAAGAGGTFVVLRHELGDLEMKHDDDLVQLNREHEKSINAIKCAVHRAAKNGFDRDCDMHGGQPSGLYVCMYSAEVPMAPSGSPAIERVFPDRRSERFESPMPGWEEACKNLN